MNFHVVRCHFRACRLSTMDHSKSVSDDDQQTSSQSEFSLSTTFGNKQHGPVRGAVRSKRSKRPQAIWRARIKGEILTFLQAISRPFLVLQGPPSAQLPRMISMWSDLHPTCATGCSADSWGFPITARFQQICISQDWDLSRSTQFIVGKIHTLYGVLRDLNVDYDTNFQITVISRGFDYSSFLKERTCGL